MRNLLWTREEMEILQKLYPKSGISKSDLMQVFPYRSWISIERKVQAMNLKRDNGKRDIDKDFLKRLLEVVDG